MELTPLRYLRAIADAGTMTVAAQRLGVSQPTLSFAVRDGSRPDRVIWVDVIWVDR